VKIEIVNELKELCLEFEKKQNRGSSFRPFRYNKYKDGANSPVFFIGSPGIAVAIYATFLIAITFYLFTLPFIWWAWLIYVLFGAFFMKLAFKLDKIKQIKTFALALSLNAIKILEIINSEDKSEEEVKSLLLKAEEFLTEAHKWLDEPNIEKQLNIIKQEIQKLQ
jgi:hypothetical protein